MTDTHADADGHAHAVPKHPYHLVDPSPWPILGSIAAGLLATGGVLFMHGYGWWLMAIGFLGVGIVAATTLQIRRLSITTALAAG